MKPLETIDYKGCIIEVHHDEDPMSPRDWDNLGTIIVWHRHYTLSDKEVAKRWKEPQDFRDWLEEPEQKGTILLPVFMYDHSGVALNTTGFSCPWDSGQVGFIYVTKADVLKDFGVTEITPEIQTKVEVCLRQEIETFSNYVGGNCYGYVVKDPNGEEVGSCWGFIGDRDYMITEAKAEADAALKNFLPGCRGEVN